MITLCPYHNENKFHAYHCPLPCRSPATMTKEMIPRGRLSGAPRRAARRVRCSESAAKFCRALIANDSSARVDRLVSARVRNGFGSQHSVMKQSYLLNPGVLKFCPTSASFERSLDNQWHLRFAHFCLAGYRAPITAYNLAVKYNQDMTNARPFVAAVPMCTVCSCTMD